MSPPQLSATREIEPFEPETVVESHPPHRDGRAHLGESRRGEQAAAQQRIEKCRQVVTGRDHFAGSPVEGLVLLRDVHPATVVEFDHGADRGSGRLASEPGTEVPVKASGCRMRRSISVP